MVSHFTGKRDLIKKEIESAELIMRTKRGDLPQPVGKSNSMKD